MSEILLSIVIPTKNRAQYCYDTVKLTLSALKPYAEVVIQDNSDNSDLAQLIPKINDKRLKYEHIVKPLSYAENFSRAIERSRGEYLCLIGDDDWVIPQINNLAEWMKSEDVDSLSPRNIIEYFFPNTLIPGLEHGQLRMPTSVKEKSKVDTVKQLKKLLEAGIIDYQTYGLPRLYHGLVRKKVLDHVKQVTGHYIGGLSPDIYATVTLSCLVRSHYVTSEIFTVAGACPQSGTAVNLNGKHAGRLEDAPHFVGNKDYKWEDEIPRYYSVETIWAETAVKALKEMSFLQLVKTFNIYSFCLNAAWRNRKAVWKLAVIESERLRITHKISRSVFYLNVLREAYKKSLRALQKRFFWNSPTKLVIFNNVDEATDAAQLIAHSYGVSRTFATID